MNLMDISALTLSALVCVGFICRADGINIRDHRPEYIALHLGLFMSSFLAGVAAYHGQTGLREWCALLGSGAWLVVSFHSWATGVPDHVRRRRAEDPSHANRSGTGHW